MQLTSHLFYHLKMSLLGAKHSVCPPTWERNDFIPGYHKLYYISDGFGQITVNGTAYAPQKGQLFFAPAGVIQSYTVTQASPYTMYWCHFTSNLDFHPLFRALRLPAIISVQHPSVVVGHFQQLIQHSSHSTLTASLKIQSALQELIAYYIDHADRKSERDASMPSLSKLIETIQYIDANLNKELSIHDLSQYAYFHPNYFIRLFKSHLGVSPMKYIFDRRLEKAKELLVCSAISIHEVAKMTGFQDPSHFSAAFKKHVGVSPSEFRQSKS
ncbi:helix-turn-helix transcriptional regulator [Paenibacillus whitsoniae]|uniref:AraC family transcriptional regulator n=1 Tax=Paenibacillus whitsoniae TaxID=2496558 RepID=A0A430JJL3_9BACL|nr:AraC family transcriptional regulator [Paenibacillus whitsoniae]RTE11244.1 AraC family transcriptional regulator [Paenibacillus whitsoniae]